MAKIIDTEEGKAIYSTIPYRDKDKEEYDYLLLKDFKNVLLGAKKINVMNSLGKTTDSNVNFEILIDDTVDDEVENLKIVSSFEELRLEKEVNVQLLVDIIAESIYCDKDLDKDERIEEIKDELVDKLISEVMNETGKLPCRHSLNTIALLYSKDGVIAVSNRVMVDADDIVFTNTISGLPCSDIDIDKVEILSKNKTIVIDKITSCTKIDGEVKVISLKVERIEIKDIKNEKYKIDTDDVEELFEEASNYLTIRQENNDITDIDLDLDLDFI